VPRLIFYLLILIRVPKANVKLGYLLGIEALKGLLQLLI